MQVFRRPGVLLAAMFLLLALPPPDAAAQLVRCSAVDEPGYKILLDDIVVEGGTGTLPMLETLKGRLAQNLEQLSVETGLPITVYRCRQRRPPDASVFRRPQVEQLYARQVVLEIWGTTGEVKDDTGDTYHEAQIGYVLIPVRLRSFTSGDPSGALTVQRRADALTIDALVRLVDQANAVPAYALLSAGTRLMRESEFEAARTHLCRAASLLLQGTPSAGDKALAAFAREEAEQALRQLKAASPELATLLPSDACGGVS